ncbi:hypothetical protein [Aeromonas sanarellii]|uniref:hypothetical protein n=1 Tax=Aeromonas sanarellii TaxID=633415 RepID=UPI003985ABC4
MKSSQRNHLLRSLTLPLGVVMLGGLHLTPAWAGIFPGLQQEACMADAYIAKGGSLSGGSLNCTAKDIEVSKVVPVNPNQECTNGQVFTFNADVTIKTNASERYDTTFYLPRTSQSPQVVQGGARNCSLVLPKASDAGENGQVAYVNLEPKLKATDFLDTCGDITKANGTDQYTLFNQPITMLCQPSPTDPNKALFTYCAAWDIQKSLSCSESTVPPGAVPATKSKCNCDSFAINVFIRPEPPAITKTVEPTSLPEPGGVFTYNLSFTNSSVASLYIASLKDEIDVGGDGSYDKSVDLWGATESVGTADGIYLLSSTCAKPAAGSTTKEVLPNATYSCQFTLHIKDRDLPNDQSPEKYVDNIVALFKDKNGGTVGDGSTCPTGFQTAGNNCSGAKLVEITNVPPTIAVEKTPSTDEVLEPGANVTYTIKVTNTAGDHDDPLTLTSLVDDKFGDLDGQGTCDLGSGVALYKGTPFQCSVTEFVGGNAGDVHTNKVTAKALDNEGDEATGEDSATVNINDVASTITLQKDAVPVSVPETGDSDEKRSVAYTFTFSVDANGVDKVTFNDLDDDVFGNLTSQCQVNRKNGAPLVPAVALAGFVLSPGESASCTLSKDLQGNADESHTNTATISGKDEDNQTVTDSDDATVEFTDVPPDITKLFALKAAGFVRISNNGVDTLTVTALTFKGVDVADGNGIPGSFTLYDEPGVSTHEAGFGPFAFCTTGGAILPGGHYDCAFVLELEPGLADLGNIDLKAINPEPLVVTLKDDELNEVKAEVEVTIQTLE